jgi:hypothetical protein
MARYSTFGQLLEWLQQPTGLTVRENRAELAETANDVRRLFYNLYEQVPLFMDIEECFCVARYAVDCSNNCPDTYLGITLSEGMQTPEMAFVNGAPVRMNSEWRSYKTGMPNGATINCSRDMVSMGHHFCTAIDPPLDGCGPIKVKTCSAADEADKKSVTLRYIAETGKEHTEHLLLTREYVKTERNVRALLSPGGIVLPHGLCGDVTIADGRGIIIAELAPHQLVPAYRRYSVSGVCVGDMVSVRASREFHPLYFDHDVVETDNKRAFVEGALFLRYNDSINQDPSYTAKALGHDIKMREALLGEKSREFGKATRRNKFLSEGSVRRSGLIGRRTWGNWRGGRR